MEVSPEKLNLELGDIIQIIAPENSSIHEHIYIITYIDNDLIKLIDDKDLVLLTLNIKDGNLTDETIQAIAILDKPEEKGYIKQNGIQKDQWLEIHFGGDVPTIITGQVTDIIEDMIELNLWPEKEKIYIDFAYKGIPLNLPITSIHIRQEAPVEFLHQKSLEKPSDLDAIPEGDEESKIPEGEKSVQPSVTGQAETEAESEEYTLKIPTQEVKDKIKDVLAEADTFSFGDDVEAVTQEVVVSDEEKRYAIDVQANDLLDEMLSTIPNIERTDKVLNKINRMINRFKELRKEYSIFNERGNIEAIIKKGSDYKPLVEKLYTLDENLYWLLPVVKNKKKLYDVNVLAEENDIETIEIGFNLEQMKQIEEQYKNNTIQGSNKYKQLIQSLNPHYTPYTIQEEDEVISEINIHSNINVIINNIVHNLQEFYTSVASNDKLKRQRFVITKYNLGLDGLTIKPGTKSEFEKEILTRSDNVPLSSFMILPEPFVRYSHINLPSTTIYDKTNLNHTNLSYWKLLRKSTSVTNHIVSSLDTEMEYDTSSFLNQIKNISLAEGLTDDEKYKKFLQIMIPRTKTLFHLVKKYIKKGTNLHDIVLYLEPFMIYRNDLSFKQYEEIVAFINENVMKIKQLNSEHKKDTNQLRTLKETIIVGMPLLLSIMQGHSLKEITELYKLNTHDLNSELFKSIIELDYGEYYMNQLSLKDSELLSNVNVQERINATIEQLDQTIDEEPSSCKDFVLTKKYISFDELNEDNGTTEVFFDKKYDQTPYDIIEEYRIQQETMEDIDFRNYLKEKLIENIGLTEEKAEHDAEAMIEGKRKVRDGQYAVVEIYDDAESEQNITRNYYKRVGNNWEFDEEVTKIALTDEQKLFCNIRNTCIQLKKDCDTIEETKDKIMKSDMEKLVKNLSEQTIEEREKLIKQIQTKSEYLENRLSQLIELRRVMLLKNNDILYKLGLSLDDSEIIVSPYSELFDKILSEQDILKRSQYIIRFVTTNTRTPFPDSDESPYWFYCPITDTKLMPTFFYELAQTILNGENYNDAVEKICAERGELSDDGDKWVDKYSGYTIIMRQFSVEEGFDEQGFKVVTNALLDEDYIVPSKDNETDNELNSREALVSKKIVSALAFYSGINIDDYRDFIIKESSKWASKQMPSKQTYAKQVEKMKLKGKKMPSYEKKYNQYILYFTSLYFLISIQTAMPGLKTRKTFPGCAKDFSGYPVHKSSFGGITYLACILRNISSSQSPWDSIKGISADGLKKNLIMIFDKLLVKDSTIQKKIQEKQTYLLEHKDEEDIPNSINVTKWTTFLPPLKDTNQGSVRGIADTFASDMMKDLREGKMRQFEKLGVIRGKIISFSLKIIEEIQAIVKKEPAILETMGGEPFLQNVCCNDSDNINTLHYFSNKNGEILNHNKKIIALVKMYNETIKLANSPILMSNKDTKVKYPSLSKEYSEDTIYKAFIYYCNYNKDLPINDNLKILCSDQKIDFEGSEDIKEQIKIIKDKGMMFNEETLLHLLKLVAKENYVHMSFEKDIYTSKESILHLLSNVEEYDLGLESRFVTLMSDMITNYDEAKKVHSSKLREIRNYLIEESETMKQEMKEFLRKYSSSSTSLKRKLLQTLDTIEDFSKLQDNNGLLSSEELTTIHMSMFMKNCITDMIDVYPNMILNEVDYSNVKPPSHWKLSQIHNKDITTFMNKNYTLIQGLYGNKEINEIVEFINSKSIGISKLMKETLFSASLNKQETKREKMFEHYLTKEVYTYLFYYTFKMYIDAQDEDITMDIMEIGDKQEQEMVEVDILSGDKLKLKQEIARVLMTYLEIITRQKNRINYNREEIMELVLRSKEKEKDTKTRQLKELTDEERRADSELRKGKLGRWNVGLQKGLTQYVKDTYDMERQEMEKEAIIDLRLGQMDVVNEMNADIFAMEMLEQQMSEHAADKEAMDMSELPEDDDYGDKDGDEGFY
jgi:hypothetical protein